MKDAIIAKFKAKYPAVNLSKKRLDAIADKLAPKITDEAEIDEKLDDMNDNSLYTFAEIAQQDDKVRDLQGKLKTTTTKETTTQSTDTDNSNQQQQSETPDWAKAMMQEFQQLKAEKAQTQIQQKVAQHERLKGVPQAFYKGRALPDKEEDLETFAQTIASDYDAFKQDLANEGLLNTSKPITGISNNGDTSKVSPMMAQYLEEKKPKA